MANTHHTTRALYMAEISDFLKSSYIDIIGRLNYHYHGNAPTTTREAWEQEVRIMRKVLHELGEPAGKIIFEYDIPRLGKRIDVVLLMHGMIFCMEFKAGKKEVQMQDVEQVMDYALDLKNFHLYSHDRKIIPILIPTEYPTQRELTQQGPMQSSMYEDQVYKVRVAGEKYLAQVIEDVIHSQIAEESELVDWDISPYSPTPTIVEAARHLYANHSVEDITKHEADKASTDATTESILSVIEHSRKHQRKSICFVTGVPGAGKTLVGLDVAVRQSYQEDGSRSDEGAVYLSGNGPLVAVLKEALARDNYKNCKERGEPKKISDSRREVDKFIQIIHRYRDNMLKKIKTPIEGGELEIDPLKAISLPGSGYGEVEHVAIFDEAQRSWTHKRIATYLARGGTYGNKDKVENFPMSEAEFLIWSMDQRQDWAVIVCLVGGGQEINTGEAGISEWISAMNGRFRHWDVYISPHLTDAEYAEGRVSELLADNPAVNYLTPLHLAVSMRSFRAESLSAFVHSMLTFGKDASSLYAEVSSKGYPLLLTRSMDKARAWLRSKARGTERTGILVSKVAARFKPLAVNILPQGDDAAVHWFLEEKTDLRSSDYLEDAATEIQVQGLELDYACVLWDADMRCDGRAWSYHRFNGRTAWTEERNAEQRKYMLNAYRVLLTRARQGLIICVPEGNANKDHYGYPEDSTRLPEFYDGVYKYFKSLGLTEI